MDGRRSAEQGANARIKSPQDLAAGLVVMLVAAIAIWLGRDLPIGTLGGMGPGMLPRSVAMLLGALGLALAASSLRETGPGLGRVSIRGLAFIGVAILAFALTVRPLGLVAAAPLVIIVGALASPETRWIETIVFGACMTVFSIGLFKFALRLPVPLAPWLLGY